MQQLEDKNNLQIIIDILNDKLANIPEAKAKYSLEEYQMAKNHMEDDVFELLSYEQLFYDNSGMSGQDFYDLCNTLKVLNNNKFFEMTDEQKTIIKKSSLYRQLIGFLDANIEKLNRGKDIRDLIGELNNCSSVLDDSLIDRIYEIVMKYDVSRENTIVIFKNIMLYINSFSNKNVKVSVQPRITEEQLVEVFSKYGYDFSMVPKDLQERFFVKGNLGNIDEMFSCMPSYGIKFLEKNRNHLYLLLKSDRNVLDRIKGLSEEYGFSFSDALRKIPASFVHRNYSADSKRVRSNEVSDDQRGMVGAFEDFCENIEIIKNLGYDIPTSMKKSITFFVVSSSRIKKNVQLLKEYGFFDGKNLAQTGFLFSGLGSYNLQDKIETFIELGELRYIRENSSRLVLGKKSDLIMKLYFAKKDGKDVIRMSGNKVVLSLGEIEDTAIDMNSIKHSVFDESLDSSIKSFLEKQLSEVSDSVDGDSFEEIRFLDDNYKKDDYAYDFNGTLISIRKVKRVYPLLLREYPDLDKKKLLLFAVTYNSLMSKEEFEKISASLSAKEKKL